MDLRVPKGGRGVRQVVLRTGAVVIERFGWPSLCTGTYLQGRTIVGECIEDSGPDGMHAAGPLTGGPEAPGSAPAPLQNRYAPSHQRPEHRLFQNGSAAGDEDPLPFSFSTEQVQENRAVCWLTYTTEETHRIILENLDRSPIYSGVIEGVGPGTAHPSRRRSSASGISPGTSCSLSPWAWTRRKCTSRAFPPPCRRRCSSECSTQCPAWSTR